MNIFRNLWKTCATSTQELCNICNPKTLGKANNVIFNSWRAKSGAKTSSGMKVTICGAAGNTGQPLALLLKQSQALDEIALYDINPTCGYGMELSHVDTRCNVSSYSGRHMLCDALKGARVVVIVARHKDGDSFENNSPIITEIALQICNTCPTAFVIVATEPIESMVPLIAEIQRLRGTYNSRMLLGSVELNCVRANTVVADFLQIPPESVRVPVIGGATARTMVPILSAAAHPTSMTQEQVECLTSCIMSGNDAVSSAKGVKTATACLAGAYAVARTTINVVTGLKGKKNVAQCGYVDHLGLCVPECQFFANEVLLGPSGIEKNLGVPELTKFENCLMWNCIPCLRNENDRALFLVYSMCMQCSYPACCGDPSCCYSPPQYPCAPPTNWANDWPDPCRDKYLAKICREMTCKCGSTELCWTPRQVDYDAVRASNLSNQVPKENLACDKRRVPRSVLMAEEIRSKNTTCCLK